MLRRFTRLKAQLMPYIYGQAVAAARDGIPVLRPMVAEFPDDQVVRTWTGSTCSAIACWWHPSSRHPGDLVLRPGRRLDASANRCDRTRPATIHEVCDFLTVPVFVRPGTVLPIGARDDRPDYPYEEDVTLRVYEFTDGDRTTVTVPATAGEVRQPSRWSGMMAP